MKQLAEPKDVLQVPWTVKSVVSLGNDLEWVFFDNLYVRKREPRCGNNFKSLETMFNVSTIGRANVRDDGLLV